MGKLTIQIKNGLEAELREYIQARYGIQRGVLGAFISDSIREKLDREKAKDRS